MSNMTNDDMHIIINSVDYSTKINSISENGGEPILSSKKAWGNHKYNVSTDYNDWEVGFSMIVGSDTESIINEIANGETTYTIQIGSANVYSVTYSNLTPSSFSVSMITSDGMEIADIKMTAPGTRDNRVDN